MGVIDSIIQTFTGTYYGHQRLAPSKYWVEYEVDTYWSRHVIKLGHSFDEVAKWFRQNSPGCELSCIGIYTGPKGAGEVPDSADVPFMCGYQGNPGPIKYYNGAKPK